MTDVRVALTCADYARVLPLATGEVRPNGIALTIILGNRGSWPARAEMLRRAVQDPEVQGGEWSMAQYLYRMEKGDRRYVGLPVFPLRNFTARDLYVRRDGPVRRPQDLAGKRIGMYSYTASGSIWYRHFLRYLGLDPLDIQWWVGDIDTPWSATPMDTSLPPGVKTPQAGRSLSDMLIADDVEATEGLPSPLRAHRQTVPGLPPGRAGVLPEDGRLSATAPGRPAARSLGGEPLDRPGPHRGVPRSQRGLHRGAERLPLRDAVARGRARGHRGRHGPGLPSVRARAEPGADRDVRRRGVPPWLDGPASHRRGVLPGLPGVLRTGA